MRRELRSVRVDIGCTGNRLDPDRRVRLAGFELTARPHVALRSTWPVREVATDRTVQLLDDLRAELTAAASPDCDADLRTLRDWWRDLLGETRESDADHAEVDLAAGVLRRAYPLLAVPIDAGARPARIPVAVEPLLAHPDPRTAARRTFGRVTRPLVRALASSLLPDDRNAIVWEPILVALMAAARCGPEQLTAILSTPVHQAGAVSFSHHEVERGRAMVLDRNPRRVAEQLCAALREPGGTARLAHELRTWDARPPAPPPAPPPPARRPRPATPAAPAPPAPDRFDRPAPYPRRFRAIDGCEVAGHRVELVARPNDLLRWGDQLSNCLGAYRMEVALGRTYIVGFSLRRELRAVAEISASGALRQLEAAANVRPPPALETAIIALLRRHRVMEVDARRA